MAYEAVGEEAKVDSAQDNTTTESAADSPRGRSTRRLRVACAGGASALAACLGAAAVVHSVTPNASSGALRLRPDFLGQSTGLWQKYPDQFFALGEGSCIDAEGDSAESVEMINKTSVLEDGSSIECEKACRADDFCTGYMTHDTQQSVWSGGKTGKCALLTDSDFQPARADGSKGAHCFWRHVYEKDSQGLYADRPEGSIPKVIWTFWQTLPEFDEDKVVTKLPPFINLCTKSWQQLNPDYTVRVLNLTSVKEWLDPSDLPKNFKDMPFQDQIIAIRLSLLARYGGLWIDAPTFMMKPLKDILPGKANERTFFHNIDTSGEEPKDVRSTAIYHANSWFLAAPPEDTLTLRTKACMLEYFASDGVRKGIVKTDMFSTQELIELEAMGIGSDMGPELVSDACLFKNVYEDQAIDAWWQSMKVRHINPTGHLSHDWWQDTLQVRSELFTNRNPALAKELTDSSVFALMFTAPMREELTAGISSKQLWCDHNTWHLVLKNVGISSEEMCEQEVAK